MSENPKKTELHGWHQANGANMADFGGYEMPLWYSSAKNEHLAVITNAGIFDTSHMASIMVDGPDALDLLQHCFTNDLNACIGPAKKPLYPGRCVYGAFLNDTGEVVDDSIIFHIGDNAYMIVVNAGMGGPVAAHINRYRGDRNVAIEDLTDRLGKMDIQGPLAARIMKKVLQNPDEVFNAMPYFSFKGHFNPDAPTAAAVRLLDGTPILLSRTGYTGEFGFEIFVASGKIVHLWEQILEAGADSGVTPCGLAARDSLRAGAVLPLSHQDIGDWPFMNNPWPFALPMDSEQKGFTKSFVGSEALSSITSPEFTLPFVGKDLRKVSTGDPAVVVDGGETIGKVLTCATDMAIGISGGKVFSIASPDKPQDFKAKGLCCGFVKVTRNLEPGHVLELKDKRRSIKVKVTRDIRPHRTARKALKEMLK